MNQSRLQGNVAVILPQATKELLGFDPVRADDLCDGGKVVLRILRGAVMNSMPGNVIMSAG
ncbi:hypothetical protein SEEV1955_20745 [Salmonella enterica subsp. enterica serovar Virchow str. ATCC 51955]|nr:hypothetical protein SEEV1955_20745 [Salmonella enterica subsp. enterica serovar Virchow str. ATCC 51955]